MVMPEGDASSPSLPHPEEKHGHALIQGFSIMAGTFAQNVASETSCQCPYCLIAQCAVVIFGHVCGQVVAAADSGDVSPLHPFLSLVEQQKRAT